MEWFRDIGRKHEALKKKIHSFRYPLGPTGQFIMKIVYGCMPLVFGYYITRYAVRQGVKNNGDPLEKPLNPEVMAMNVEFFGEDFWRLEEGRRIRRKWYKDKGLSMKEIKQKEYLAPEKSIGLMGWVLKDFFQHEEEN